MKLFLLMAWLPLTWLEAAVSPAPGTFVSILDFEATTNKHDNTEAIQQTVNTVHAYINKSATSLIITHARISEGIPEPKTK